MKKELQWSQLVYVTSNINIFSVIIEISKIELVIKAYFCIIKSLNKIKWVYSTGLHRK